MGRAILHLLLVVLAAVVLFFAVPQAYRPQGVRLETYHGELARRREQAARDPRVVRIAVVWPKDGSRPESLFMGAQIAAEEVNRKTLLDPDLYREEYFTNPQYFKNLGTENGQKYCAGVPIKIPRDNGKFELRCTQIRLDRIDPCSDEEVEKAKDISADPRYVAVVGHSGSDIAKHASIRYQYANLLFFSVNATDPSLTTHGFGFVFRNIPTDEEVAEALAKTLIPFRSDKVGILYAPAGPSREVRYSHMLSAVNIFSSAGTRRQPGLDITFQEPYGSVRLPNYTGPCVPLPARLFDTTTERLYDRHVRRLRASVNEARQNGVQVMMLLDDQPQGAKAALTQIRLHGPEMRVLGGPAVDSPAFFDAPAQLVRLPATTAPVSYFSLPVGSQAKAEYVRARARELSFLFVGDWGAPIQIDEQTGRRVVELIGAQLDAARVREGEDLQSALTLVDSFSQDVTKTFEQGREQNPRDPWFVPGALGIYLGVLETTLANAAQARPGAPACLNLPTATPIPTLPPTPSPQQIGAGARTRVRPARATAPPVQWSFATGTRVGDFRPPQAPQQADWCDADKVRGTEQEPGTYQKAAAFLRATRDDFLPVNPADVATETPAAATVLALLTYKYGPQPYRERIEERIRSVIRRRAEVEDLDEPTAQKELDRVLNDPIRREEALWSLLAPPSELNYERSSLDPEGFLWRLFATAIIGENPADFGIKLRALSYVPPGPCTTSVASVFSPALKIESVQNFVRAYQERYKNDPREAYRDAPDSIAAQGYEAIKVLTQAYARKGSVVPTEAASILRLRQFDGLTGKISFTGTGDVENKLIFLKVFAGEGPAEFGCTR